MAQPVLSGLAMRRSLALLLCLAAASTSAGVNPDGSFTWDVAIELPQIGPGPKPSLSLNYHSMGGNGPVGVGWQLSGLAAVSRLNYTSPISYTASDTFVGPSGRLIAMGDGSYHSETEDWTRFVPAPSCGTGPCSWLATDRLGNQLQFASGANGQSWDSFNRGVRTWGLTSFTDPRGNSYSVAYFTDGFQLYPSRVLTATHTVDFVWAARNDVILDHSQGSAVTITKRLSQVVVKSVASGQLVRQYTLEYEYAPDTGHSRVIGISAIGSDGVTVERKQRFVWGVGTGFSTMPVTSSGVSLPDGQRMLADVNGDGFADVVALPKNSTSCSISVTPQMPPQGSSSGFGTAVTTNSSCSWNSSFSWPGDFNADGKLDFAMRPDARNDAVQVWLGNSSNGFSVQTWAMGSNAAWGAAEDTFSGDFNGDGKTDLATRSGSAYRVFLNTGTGFTTQTWNAGTLWGQPGGRWAGDFDGDGKTDLASITGGPGAYRLVVLRSLGTSFSVESWPLASGVAWNLTRLTRLGDFNGDGKTDFLTRSNETIAQTFVHLSTGRSLVSYPLAYSLGLESLITQGDFNGDGKTDLMRWSGNTTLGYVYLSTGAGFTQKSDPQAFDYNATTRYVTMPLTGDLNGDGITDTFVKPENQNPTRRFRGANRDRINHLYSGYNSVSADLQVTYLPAPQMAGAVNPYSSTCNVGNTSGAACGFANASARPLVSRLVTSDGLGALYGVGYQFKNGRLLPGVVGTATNLGFESLLATEEATGKVTESFLWQTRPFTGLIRLSRVYLWSSGPDVVPILLEATENLSWTQYRCSDSGCVVDNSLFTNAPRQIRALGNSFKHFELGTLLSEDRSTLQYDAWGNQTSTGQITIRNGATVATDIRTATFINQPAAALRTVGLPRTRAHWSNVNGFNSSEEEILYDSLPLGSVGARGEPTTSRARRGGPAFSWEETVRTFDARGNLLTERAPTGLVTSHEYSADGQVLTAITDVDGRIELTVDRRSGEVVKTHRADGLDVTIELDVWLRPTTTTWSNNGQILKKSSVEAPVVGGYKRECNYSGASFTVATCVQHRLDALGREITITRLGPGREHPTVTKEYDGAGRLWRVSQPFFVGTNDPRFYTVFAYDVVGRMSTATGPDGAVSRYTYNQGSFAPLAVQKQTVVNPRGYATIHHKDARGNLVRAVEGSTCATCTVEPGATTTYGYDADGLLTSVGKPDGTSVTYGYDTRGRRIAANDPNHGLNLKSYYDVPGTAAYGQLKAEQRPVDRGVPGAIETISYAYDGRGRITSRAHGGGAWQTVYSYDPSPTGHGVLKQVDHLDGNLLVTTLPARDGLDREVGLFQSVRGSLADGTKVSDDSEVWYELDALGQVTSIKYPDGQVANREFDAWGHLTSVKLNPVSVTFDGFDARGEWQKSSLGNGVTVDRSFDARTGRIIKLAAGTATAQVQSLGFTWDLAGNLTRLDDGLTGAVSTTYSYDALDRVVQARRDSGEVFNYGFDSGGNLVTKSTFDAAGAVVTRVRSLLPGTNRLADDGNAVALKYGPSGNLIDRGAISYDYGADSMLTRVTSGGQASEASGFDARQRRVAHVEHRANGVSLLSITVADLYVSKLRLESGSVKAAQQQHLLFNGPMHVATMVTGTLDLDAPGQQGPASRYHFADHLASTAVVTDDAAQVVTRVFYAPSGEIDRNRSSVGTESRLFTGLPFDRNSGLTLMGARMYDPGLGQFISPDTMVPNAGTSLDFLSYQYAHGNPLKYTDPSGHFVWLPVIVGAVIGFALGGSSFGLLTDPGKWWDIDYLVDNWSWKRAIAGAAIGAIAGTGWSLMGQIPGSVLGVKASVLVKNMALGAALDMFSSVARGEDGAGDLIKAFCVGAATSFMSKTGFFGLAGGLLRVTSGWRAFLCWSGTRLLDSLVYSLVHRAVIDEDYPIEFALPFVTISRQDSGTITWRIQYLAGVRFLALRLHGADLGLMTDFSSNHTEQLANRVGTATGARRATIWAFTFATLLSANFEIDKLDYKDLLKPSVMAPAAIISLGSSLAVGGRVYDRYRVGGWWDDFLYDPNNPPAR